MEARPPDAPASAVVARRGPWRRIARPCLSSVLVGLAAAATGQTLRESVAGGGTGLFIYEFLVAWMEPAGGLLYAVVALLAWGAAAIGRADGWHPVVVQGIARGRRPIALLLVPVLAAGTLVVYRDFPLSMDEFTMLFQAEVFAAGELAGRFPAELAASMIPPFFLDYFFKVDAAGRVVSTYLPGFASLLAPFARLGVPWLLNPLLAAGCLLMIYRLARRWGGAEAGGWAVLLTLASPQFIVTSISYYSMTAHLFFNLLFVWGLVRGGDRAALLAGVTGSIALVLHQPIAHALVALPWLAWLLWTRRWRRLAVLGLGYLPLTLALGLGWQTVQWQFAAEPLTVGPPVAIDPSGVLVRGPVPSAATEADTPLEGALGAFRVPTGALLLSRLLDLAKLFTWSVPFLPLLAILGWRKRRSSEAPELSLLAVSAVATLGGYFFVAFNQGHGWGYRYFHQIWGVLPILAALALVRPVSGDDTGSAWRRASATAVLLGLVVLVPLRLHQTHQVVTTLAGQLPDELQAEDELPRAAFVSFRVGYYRQDLVRNDPFLRHGPLLFWSQGPELDEALIRHYFPAARLERRLPSGDSVWLLQLPAAR